MTDLRRWELLADAVAVGDRLPDDDARFVDDLDDLDAQTERDVYAALADLGRTEAVTEADLTTAEQLLVARRGAAEPRRRGWAIGIGVAAAAIVVLAIGLPRAISGIRDGDAEPSAGGLLSDVDGREADVRDATRDGTREGVRSRGGAKAPAQPEEAEPEPEPEAEPEPEPDEVRILEDGEPEPAVKRKPARAPEPPPSAGEMLAQARELVLDGAEGKALSVYEKLRRAYPSSSEARVANVSIGEIQLQRGKASAALAAFDRYLASGGGSLREEALWGRVRALHRLGRTQARDEAAERLRTKFPKSVYLSRLPK